MRREFFTLGRKRRSEALPMQRIMNPSGESMATDCGIIFIIPANGAAVNDGASMSFQP